MHSHLGVTRLVQLLGSKQNTGPVHWSKCSGICHLLLLLQGTMHSLRMSCKALKPVLQALFVTAAIAVSAVHSLLHKAKFMLLSFNFTPEMNNR